jgi:hypothetical protein
MQKWTLTYERRQNINWQALFDFLLDHDIDQLFWIEDKELGFLERVTCTSSLKTVPEHHNLKTFSIIVESAA